MVGDQPEELLRLEPAHQHEMLAHQQSEHGSGKAGGVSQRHRDQVDVAVLLARQIAECRG
jgi:hypothetical protein